MARTNRQTAAQKAEVEKKAADKLAAEQKAAAEEEARKAEEQKRLEAEQEAARLAEQQSLKDTDQDDQDPLPPTDDDEVESDEQEVLVAEDQPIVTDNDVARAVLEQAELNLARLTATGVTKREGVAAATALIHLFDRSVKLKSGEDMIATMDVLVQVVRKNMAEGKGFHSNRAFQHMAEVQAPQAMRTGYMTLINWIYVIIGHLDDAAATDYAKDFDHKILQDDFPGEVGERLVAYGARICGQ